jgi:hypothetical protein
LVNRDCNHEGRVLCPAFASKTAENREKLAFATTFPLGPEGRIFYTAHPAG